MIKPTIAMSTPHYCLRKRKPKTGSEHIDSCSAEIARHTASSLKFMGFLVTVRPGRGNGRRRSINSFLQVLQHLGFVHGPVRARALVCV